MENGRAKLALLNCTERVTVGPFSHFSDEQIQGTGKKKSLQNAEICLCEYVLFLISRNIQGVSHYPHLLAKVRHQQPSGIHLAHLFCGYRCAVLVVSAESQG